MHPYFKLSSWVLEPAPSTFAPNSRWSNKDMDPVPPNMRTWTTMSYVAYWISDAVNVASWELASSMLAIGLSWCVCRPFVSCPRIVTLKFAIQASGPPSHCSWAYNHINRHSLEWHNWCSAARCIPRLESFILRVLVQLFQCTQ